MDADWVSQPPSRRYRQLLHQLRRNHRRRLQQQDLRPLRIDPRRGGNTASGEGRTITGGVYNKTVTTYSSVNGGCSNLAGTGAITVNSICTDSKHADDFPSILGGTGNQAEAENSTVSGGAFNLAGGTFASSVSGGKENKATGEEASISGGGGGGEASAPLASIVGGRLGKAPHRASTVLGGLGNVTGEEFGISP